MLTHSLRLRGCGTRQLGSRVRLSRIMCSKDRLSAWWIWKHMARHSRCPKRRTDVLRTRGWRNGISNGPIEMTPSWTSPLQWEYQHQHHLNRARVLTVFINWCAGTAQDFTIKPRYLRWYDVSAVGILKEFALFGCDMASIQLEPEYRDNGTFMIDLVLRLLSRCFEARIWRLRCTCIVHAS